MSDMSPLKQALLAIEDLQARLDAAERAQQEPIAVIGMSCRFPGGANDPDSFWQLLHEGRDVISEVPPSRWDVNALYDPNPDAPGKMCSRYGGFLEGVDVDAFDAQFFRIAPREAMSMDPQQRLLLEVSWEALERAGQPQEVLTGSPTGVFVGIGMNDYSQLQLRSGDLARIDAYTGAGNFLCFAAGRISYLLGLQGPCLALDTACSSSLVAVHLACQSLRSGECRMAIAGGVQLMLSPEATIAISRTRALAPDGRCKTFDSRADGFVRGEGCGVVVLKPLSDAITAGDDVLAVIRGSAVNHDGPSAGLTVPNGPAQEAVIRQALAAARVEPSQVGYIEAHGTGTSLGDPIEMRALGAVLGAGRGAKAAGRRFGVGSVKTNFGHLEAAAGMASLLKVILALQHREIPAHLHLQQVSPHISFDDVPAYIPTTSTPWPALDGRRIAGISSFGASGTNAHVVVEEHQPAPRSALPESQTGTSAFAVLPLSARSAEALDETVAVCCEFLQKAGGRPPAFTFEDLCRTAATRRSHHEHRVAVVAQSIEEARAQLEDGNRVLRGRKPVSRPRVIFVFSGQGTQWQGMACELLDREAVFRDALVECDKALQPFTRWPLFDELRRSAQDSRLSRTEIAQPALFAVQYAVVALWRSWGIRPDAVIGHSMGEVAACCAAGVLSLDDAARLIALRGQLMSEAAGMGRMTSVEMPADAVELLLRRSCSKASIAAINSPAATVIAGPVAAMDDVEKELGRSQVPMRRLPVDYAFHSAEMKIYGERLAKLLSGLPVQRPSIPVFSTVTGERAADLEFNAVYWQRNVAEPVRFAAAVNALIDDGKAGNSVFLEIGPHPVLAANIAESLELAGVEGAALPSLRRGQSDHATILATLAGLYTRGFAVDWKALYPRSGPVVSLPAYPWQKAVHRVEAPPAADRPDDPCLHPLIGRAVQSPVMRHVICESTIAAGAPAFLADHVVHGRIVFPAAGYMEMALAAAERAMGRGQYAVEDFVIREPLELPASGTRTVQVAMLPEGENAEFEIFSRDSEWKRHAGGTLRKASEEDTRQHRENLTQLQARCTTPLTADTLYEQFREIGLDYGSRFRAVETLWLGSREAIARIQLPAGMAGDRANYIAHPVLLDACLQVAGAAVHANSRDTYLPVAFDQLRISSPLPSTLWTHARLRGDEGSDPSSPIADVRIFDEAGESVGGISGLLLRRAGARRAPADWFYEVAWNETGRSGAVMGEPAQWLIFMDAEGTGEAFARLLETNGHRVVRVESGAGYDELLRGEYRGVVHFWSLCESPERSGCSILHILQHFGNDNGIAPPRLWLVTRGAQPVTGGTVFIDQAPVWGLGRVVALEQPEMWGGLIDLDPSDSENSARDLFDEICGAGNEGQVAFRGGRRFVARLRRRPPSRVTAAPAIVADGSYLITGGFGGLGGVLARWLVDQGARHLILAGRSAPADAGKELQRELEAAGAQVIAAQTDVANDSDVARLLSLIETDSAPLRGVFHAAGVLADAVLLQLDWDRVQKTMAPKAAGAFNLHRRTLGLPLDYFVMFSSAASILGSPGQGGYSAANAYLDALAHYRQSLGLPALSINWGPWEEVGMAASSNANTARRWAGAGMQRIGLQDGMSAFELLLASGMPQAAVLRVNWPQYVNQVPAGSARSYIADLVSNVSNLQPHARESLVRLLRDSAAADRAAIVLSFMREQVERVIGLRSGSLESQVPLTSLGLDSLMGVDLRNAIRAALGVNIQVAKILEGASAAELAALALNQWTAASLMAPARSAANAVGNLEEVEI